MDSYVGIPSQLHCVVYVVLLWEINDCRQLNAVDRLYFFFFSLFFSPVGVEKDLIKNKNYLKINEEIRLDDKIEKKRHVRGVSCKSWKQTIPEIRKRRRQR